jgi:chromosome segregation ATPase
MKDKLNKIPTWFWITLFVVIVGLLAYEGYSYYQIRQDLVASEKEKELLKVELEQTQQKIEEQKVLLEQVTAEKDKFFAESEDLKGKLALLQENFDKAKIDNDRLVKEVGDLKEDLRLWNGDIKDLKEIKLVVNRRRRSVSQLRSRVWDIKEKIQQEIDRVEMEMGNQGYLVKDGKPTPVPGSIELEKIIVTRPLQK